MTTWYGFEKKGYSRAPMTPSLRIPDRQFEQSVAKQVNEQLSLPPQEIVPCCIGNQPCKTWVEWSPRLSECEATFIPWGEATDGRFLGVEIGQKDSRIWDGDLNDRHYGRSLISGAMWWSESTKPHINNRQLFAQYLQATRFPDYSPHEKRIDTVGDSYAMLRHKYGPNGIQYTSF